MLIVLEQTNKKTYIVLFGFFYDMNRENHRTRMAFISNHEAKKVAKNKVEYIEIIFVSIAQGILRPYK